MANLAVDKDFHDIVARAVDEVHGQPHRVWPDSVETTRDGRKNEIVFNLAAFGWIHQGAEWRFVLVVDKLHAQSRWKIFHSDEAHSSPIASVGRN